MKSKKIGDLLYHSVHGMCRVKEIVKEQGSSDSYALVPQLFSRMKLRYLIPQDSLMASGFRAPVTIEEAGEILEYFRTGRKEGLTSELKTAGHEHTAWAMAETMMSCSRAEFQFKEQRMRAILQRNASGLVRELALVLKISLRAAVSMIQKNLRGSSKLNPAILSALEKAVDE